jgi:hypothetical protein
MIGHSSVGNLAIRHNNVCVYIYIYISQGFLFIEPQFIAMQH